MGRPKHWNKDWIAGHMAGEWADPADPDEELVTSRGGSVADTQMVPNTQIRYEELPGELIFPGVDPSVRLVGETKFTHMDGPECDEVRKFTIEELERFKKLGGKMADIGFCEGDTITLGVRLDNFVFEPGE